MVILNVWIKIVHNLISKAILSHQLNKQEIVSLLSNDDCNEVLFKAADEVRKKFVGDESATTTVVIAGCDAIIKILFVIG